MSKFWFRCLMLLAVLGLPLVAGCGGGEPEPIETTVAPPPPAEDTGPPLADPPAAKTGVPR